MEDQERIKKLINDHSPLKRIPVEKKSSNMFNSLKQKDCRLNTKSQLLEPEQSPDNQYNQRKVSVTDLNIRSQLQPL
jgi:hypothetical protein